MKDVMCNGAFSSSSLKLGFYGNISTLVDTLFWGNERETPLETYWGLPGYWKTNEILLISQVILDSNDIKRRANRDFSIKFFFFFFLRIYPIQNKSMKSGHFIKKYNLTCIKILLYYIEFRILFIVFP